MEFFDTHAHLYVNEFDADRNKVVEDAFTNEVNQIVLPAIDSNSHQNLIDLASQYPGKLLPLMGLHPTSVDKGYKNELSIVEKYISQGSLFYGIGEIGIDLYWDKSHLKEQLDAFVTQVNWAKELGLPVVIHTRDSFDVAKEALKPLADSKLKGVFHCFAGSYEQAHQAVQMGFKLGIGGVVTFKNSTLSGVIKQIGLEHLVLETDSPYLAPVPYRGKRNESSYLALVAKKLSEVFNVPVEEVAKTTSANATKLFLENQLIIS
jgi:TatD DNase family protein